MTRAAARWRPGGAGTAVPSRARGPALSDPDFPESGSARTDQAADYTVRGGVGSISYALGEIAAAGGRLQDIADQLAATAARVADAAAMMDRATVGVFSYPFQALEQLRTAAAGCGACQYAVQELAQEARTAAARYQQTELENAAFIARQQSIGAYFAGMQLRLAGPVAGGIFGLWQLGAAGGEARARGLRDVAEDAVASAPEYLAGLLGVPPGFAALLSRPPEDGGLAGAPFGAAAASGVRRFLDDTGLFLPGRLQLARLQPADWNPAQTKGRRVLADGSVAGIMAPTLHDAFAGSKDAYTVAPSAVVVKRVDRADGSTVWVVDLPGTEVWQPLDSANVWDLEGDLEGLTSSRRAMFEQKQVLVEELVRAALTDAGARPDEGVMINAHSGGGIHAAAMAADPAFLARVNVRILNIAGAPAANMRVRPGIKVLDLENADDIVAAADLQRPPEGRDWVSVTTARRPSSSGALPGRLIGQAHDLNNYVSDAARLDASQDTSVLAHREAMLEFFGAAALTGSVAFRKYVYQGTDRNGPRKSQRRSGQVTGAPGPSP